MKYTGALARFPARAMFGTYLLAIFVGGLLLYLPISRQYPVSDTNPHITLVDSFFTATSAVCVTGLSVRSTGNYFSFFGQLVLLLLIQIGGIGIMTLTTFFSKILGAGDSLRERQTLSETLGHSAKEGVRRIGVQVLGATLVIEAVGVFLLLPSFMQHPVLADRPVSEALWWSVFHSVSAFCNAGFSLHDDNLVPWRGDPFLNFTIMGLIILGGIGFPVLADLRRTLRRQTTEVGRPWSRLWGRLQLTTKLMLVGTLTLILVGAVTLGLLEWNRALAGLPWHEKLLTCLFASVTPRTAGFNTVDYGRLTAASLFITMLLMLIGGGSGSTAGGLKVTTVLVLLALGWSRLRGKPIVVAFQRTIPPETIYRAGTIVLLFGLLTILGTTAVIVLFEAENIEHGFFLKGLFEVVSALCTVGLSTGITAELADMAKLALVALMFAGRIGPLSLYVVLAREERGVRARPVREDVLVG